MRRQERVAERIVAAIERSVDSIHSSVHSRKASETGSASTDLSSLEACALMPVTRSVAISANDSLTVTVAVDTVAGA
jgi:hypothetical protein